MVRRSILFHGETHWPPPIPKDRKAGIYTHVSDNVLAIVSLLYRTRGESEIDGIKGLAKAAKVSASTVQRAIAGRTSVGIETLAGIADAVDLKPGSLVNEGECKEILEHRLRELLRLSSADDRPKKPGDDSQLLQRKPSA